MTQKLAIQRRSTVLVNRPVDRPAECWHSCNRGVQASITRGTSRSSRLEVLSLDGEMVPAGFRFENTRRFRVNWLRRPRIWRILTIGYSLYGAAGVETSTH